MKILVGLGNPGPEYEKNRHNIGFVFLDFLARRWNIDLSREKFGSLYGEGFFNQEKILLLKPQKYMNLSGAPVARWMSFYKAAGEDLLVMHDEVDLGLGKVKLQKGSGAAGHNGIRSIKESLGHLDFYRLRLGVGRPSRGQVRDFVLSNFNRQEEELLKNTWPFWAKGVELFMTEGLDAAQLLLHTGPGG